MHDEHEPDEVEIDVEAELDRRGRASWFGFDLPPADDDQRDPLTGI